MYLSYVISLPSDTSGRGTVPAESSQKSQDASLCPENKGSNEDARGLSKESEEPGKNENSSPAEGTLTEVTPNGSGQQDEETESDPVLDAEGTLEESASEQNSVQETSTNCMAVMPEPLSHSVLNLEEPKLSNSISSDHSGSDFHLAQTEERSVANICTAEEGECMAKSCTLLSEAKGESDVNSVARTAADEGEITPNDPECSPDPAVNGQVPTFILNSTTLAKDKELPESKNVSVATANAPKDAHYVSGNGVPLRGSGAEPKKGKVSRTHTIEMPHRPVQICYNSEVIVRKAAEDKQYSSDLFLSDLFCN
jgi:hypothetical protein